MRRKAALLMLAALASPGCLPSRLREQHVMQVDDVRGEVGYYRVSITADATLAKSHYRAGLYDAEALDALLTGVGEADQDAVDRTLERLRREAVANVGQSYYRALQDPNQSDAAIDERAGRLGRAMESPYLTVARLDRGTVGPPRRKFALIFSALASVVEETIAAFAEDKETQETILTSVASLKRDEAIRSVVQEEEKDRSLARLEALLADALKARSEAPLAGATADDRARFLARVQRLFADAASVRVP